VSLILIIERFILRSFGESAAYEATSVKPALVMERGKSSAPLVGDGVPCFASPELQLHDRWRSKALGCSG
jgi:hypothetical protein